MAEVNDQEKIRADRRQRLIDQERDVYPARLKHDHRDRVADILGNWELDKRVNVAGRVKALRVHGGSAFLDIVDDTAKIQLYLEKDTIDFLEESKAIDLGDFVEVQGLTYVTKKGEKTVKASEPLIRLNKTLRPLPSTWHGLADVETRYRWRELDLLSNDEVKQIFLIRGKILHSVRQFLVEQDFLEVETPMLHSVPGGATARPFVTHHNALDIDLFLRVAPELYLKRLIVGGYGRVFEIGRNFRNEGIDRDHNPEFTMMECYAAYTDYQWMMNLTEDLLIYVTKAVREKTEIIINDSTIDLKKPFKRITYHDAIKNVTKIDIDKTSDEELREQGRKIKTDLSKNMNRAQMIDEIFKTHVRSTIIEPTFLFDYPIELSPLAKKKIDNPKYTERFQLLAGGTELGNAFSELNDPVDQRERFEAQEKLRAKGDDEAQPIDETYIRSLEYGMPPTSGLGIGIDRLTALLTNQKSLKDVILFPTLKPESHV